ncbi:MAG: hypothetical protein LBQ71_22285 [Hungatella sp.]|nr:hypothetical protein [Hungatella sp.]
MKTIILILDVGMTSIKNLLYDREVNLKGSKSHQIESLYPDFRRIEQDPERIFNLVVQTAKELIAEYNLTANQIAEDEKLQNSINAYT